MIETYETPSQKRYIVKHGQHEIDICINEDGITVEIHKSDDVVASCGVDFD